MDSRYFRELAPWPALGFFISCSSTGRLASYSKNFRGKDSYISVCGMGLILA